MTQRTDDAGTTKRHVHPNGTISHFHVRDGAVFLVSVQPEHPGRPALLTRAEVLAAWDAVAVAAKRDAEEI